MMEFPVVEVLGVIAVIVLTAACTAWLIDE